MKSIQAALIRGFIFLLPSLSFSQENEQIPTEFISSVSKGDVIILEVRLNTEDQFRTIEGTTSSMSRVALFTGDNEGEEIIFKGFMGYNQVINYLNQLKNNGFDLIEVYDVPGESLIVKHYLLEKVKK